MGKDLLHDQVGHSILIHVQSRNGECGLVRLECQLRILTGSDVKPDVKQLTALELTRIHQDCPIGPAVVVKVCGDKFKAQGVAQQALCSTGL